MSKEKLFLTESTKSRVFSHGFVDGNYIGTTFHNNFLGKNCDSEESNRSPFGLKSNWLTSGELPIQQMQHLKIFVTVVVAQLAEWLLPITEVRIQSSAIL